ncbi:hypothetical protein CLAIMM_01112 isoform 2, partial [Cladophialophora immunda]
MLALPLPRTGSGMAGWPCLKEPPGTPSWCARRGIRSAILEPSHLSCMSEVDGLGGCLDLDSDSPIYKTHWTSLPPLGAQGSIHRRWRWKAVTPAERFRKTVAG